MKPGSTLRQLRLETSWGPLQLAGGSRAGDGTLILLPQLQLALDSGRPHHALPAMNTVVISHGHADHIGGLPYWASQRQLQSMGPARLVAPDDIAGDLETLLATMARLEGGSPYDISIRGVSDGSSLALRRGMEMRFFATDHWVPTLGSLLVWRRHRLLPRYADLDGDEIARRRQRGEILTEDVATPLLAYCADSGPGVFDRDDEIVAAEVLLVECSFARPTDLDRARRFGHMHLDDLVARAGGFCCRHLVLLHASRRYRLREIEALIDERLRPALECELHHLMVDWD